MQKFTFLLLKQGDKAGRSTKTKRCTKPQAWPYFAPERVPIRPLWGSAAADSRFLQSHSFFPSQSFRPLDLTKKKWNLSLWPSLCQGKRDRSWQRVNLWLWFSERWYFRLFCNIFLNFFCNFCENSKCGPTSNWGFSLWRKKKYFKYCGCCNLSKQLIWPKLNTVMGYLLD